MSGDLYRVRVRLTLGRRNKRMPVLDRVKEFWATASTTVKVALGVAAGALFMLLAAQCFGR
jgi:hypothetical protein